MMNQSWKKKTKPADNFRFFTQNSCSKVLPNQMDMNKDISKREKFGHIMTFLLFLIFTPLLHFVYVFYCCYKQFRFHYDSSIDFPAFVPMSVIEILESVPQCNKPCEFYKIILA